MNGKIQKLFLACLLALVAGLQSMCSTHMAPNNGKSLEFNLSDFTPETLVYRIKLCLRDLHKNINPQTSADEIYPLADELETRIDKLPVSQPANRPIIFAGAKLDTVSIERSHVLKLIVEARLAADRQKKVPGTNGRTSHKSS